MGCQHCLLRRGTLHRWMQGNLVCWRAFGTAGVKQASASQGRKVTPVFSTALGFSNRTAIVDNSGSHTYRDLYASSHGLAHRIAQTLGCGSGDVGGQRISFLCANDASYTVSQWASWMCGGTAVPLYRKHPPSELEYIITNSQSSLLVAGHPYVDTLEPLADKLGLPCLRLPATSSLTTQEIVADTDGLPVLPENDWAQRPAMIIYTSGTTGRPKGVLHTHSNIQAMVSFFAEHF